MGRESEQRLPSSYANGRHVAASPSFAGPQIKVRPTSPFSVTLTAPRSVPASNLKSIQTTSSAEPWARQSNGRTAFGGAVRLGGPVCRLGAGRARGLRPRGAHDPGRRGGGRHRREIRGARSRGTASRTAGEHGEEAPSAVWRGAGPTARGEPESPAAAESSAFPHVSMLGAYPSCPVGRIRPNRKPQGRPAAFAVYRDERKGMRHGPHKSDEDR